MKSLYHRLSLLTCLKEKVRFILNLDYESIVSSKKVGLFVSSHSSEGGNPGRTRIVLDSCFRRNDECAMLDMFKANLYITICCMSLSE